MTDEVIAEFTDKDKARFWRKVDKTSSEKGCWIWTAAKYRNGYGSFRAGGMQLIAHRVSFILNGGTFDNGPLVLHGPCNRRDCVNPGHLSSGNQKQNMADRHRDGTANSGDRNGSRTRPDRVARGDRHSSRTKPEMVARGDRHWSRTHPEKTPRGEAHGCAKLTESQVLEIRRRAANGERQKDIGMAFGFAQAVISNIVNRKRWKHV